MLAAVFPPVAHHTSPAKHFQYVRSFAQLQVCPRRARSSFPHRAFAGRSRRAFGAWWRGYAERATLQVWTEYCISNRFGAVVDAAGLRTDRHGRDHRRLPQHVSVHGFIDGDNEMVGTDARSSDVSVLDE